MFTTSISLDVLQNVFRPIIAIIYFLALVPTLFRLIYRAWVRRLWWDDLWAAFSMVNAALIFSTYFWSTLHVGDVISKSYSDFIYISTLLATNLALWAARLSVAVTIVRVIATGTVRLVSKIVAVVFCLFSITLLVQKLVVCGPPSSKKFLCSNPILTGYSELVTSLIADAWLLGAPAYLLWKMNLRKRHHRLLQTIFACEIFVLSASIVHSVYIVRQDYLLQAVTSHFEIGISLIVCNLLFLVTYVYRIFHNSEETSFEESTTSASSRHTNMEAVQHSNIASSSLVLSALTSVYISYTETDTSGSSSKATSDSSPCTGQSGISSPGSSEPPSSSGRSEVNHTHVSSV